MLTVTDSEHFFVRTEDFFACFFKFAKDFFIFLV